MSSNKFTFKQATKEKLKLRLALAGISGGGKTYSALRLAKHLAKGSPVAVIDTERGSARLYAPKPGESADEAKGTFDFLHCELESFHPKEYIEALDAAEEAVGASGVIVIDSLSHAWFGKDGVLEEVDKLGARMGSKFNAWGPVGQLQNQLIDRILHSKCHVIVTMRTKMEHVQEKDERNRTVVKKVGMKVIQRDDVEFEFTVYAVMDQDNNLRIEKTRCSALASTERHGGVFNKPGKELADILNNWLEAGGEPEVKVVVPQVSWDDKVAQGLEYIASAPTEMVDELKAYLTENFPKGVCPDPLRAQLGKALTEKLKAAS